MAPHPVRGLVHDNTLRRSRRTFGKRSRKVAKSEDAIQPPEWSEFAKQQSIKKKSPSQADWWYFRTASVMRKVGVNGPIGTERLSRHYSGARDRGGKPNRSENGSRKVLRLIMQQLEVAGFLERQKGGRNLTPKGQSMLDNTAFSVKKVLQKEITSLSKY